ncbi:MAG TPA: DUF4332 domain-containing protein [Candidatus Limnocylindrales bacterium]|nr:DUF4332 domain-containing protein [Candidatus Limnocylindrales bacterium]
MPPIEQLQRVPLIHLERMQRQGLFTTGLLLEVSETPTRRQYLADQINATTNDVNEWRDEALLLNLASFGAQEQEIFTQAGIIGLADLLALDLGELKVRIGRAAREIGHPAPEDRTIDGWHEQARTLEEE